MHTLRDIGNALAWRIPRYRRMVMRLLGVKDTQWARVVMDRETANLIRQTNYSAVNALEISGDKWKSFGIRTYRSWRYPEFDICATVNDPECCDLLIAEQVFEHILWPYRAARNVYELLRPGGFFLITTPFLLRVHNHPVDCSRWTEVGIKHLLAEAGFPLESIRTASWGNRKCIQANFRRWMPYIPWLHSLSNEADFPVVVWAFAQKPKCEV